MSRHRSGCLLCGAELQYCDQAKTLECAICGQALATAAACADGHFVCDACHARAGYEAITQGARRATSPDPVAVANDMMKHRCINMHGPEHHYLIVAALLAACKNAGGRVDLETALSKARERAEKVPGGICGLWGCCGAGVGAGIFISIISGATPLSEREWGLANKMTSLSLDAISRNGGPRCCKRDTYLSIMAAVDFVKEHFGVAMEKSADIRCGFYGRNPSCKKTACRFYHPETI